MLKGIKLKGILLTYLLYVSSVELDIHLKLLFRITPNTGSRSRSACHTSYTCSCICRVGRSPVDHMSAMHDVFSHGISGPGARDSLPRDIIPHDASPRDIINHDVAPRDIIPHDAYPRDIIPHDVTPRDIIPHDVSSRDIIPS